MQTVNNKQRAAGRGATARRQLAVLLLWFASATGSSALAQDNDAEQDELDLEIEFENDELPAAVHPLTPSLFYGAEVEVEQTSELDYDLDDEVDADEIRLEPFFKFRLAYIPAQHFDAVVSFELARELLIERPPDEPTPPTRLDLTEAYVTFRLPGDGVSLKLGRQSFDDEREWLYDEELDAARLFYGVRNFGLEASVSRQTLFDRDLLNDDDADRINNYFLLGRYLPDEDVVIEGYAFLRDDREPQGERPIFLGLRSYGAATDAVDYWVEVAWVTGRGEGDPDQGDHPDLEGYGFDIGATHVLDLPLEPSLTLGFAYGSGDNDVADGTDGNFRQTGLQANSDEFNGVANFNYYGQAFEPELSNLAILTLGGGVRPSEETSIDLVYHRYWQDEAVDEIRESNFDREPEGEHRDLGSEIDLVVGYEPRADLGMELVVGWFMPGEAFSDEADDAFFIGFEAIYVF